MSSTTAPTPARLTLVDMALAAAAAKLIRPGSTIALARGNRAYALAGRVATMPGVSVVTNSLWIAQVLHDHGKAEDTLLTGGVGGSGGGLVGSAVSEALHGIPIDTFFYDADGIESRAGLTTRQSADALADTAIIHAADRVVVMAPAAMWGRVNGCLVAPISTIQTLITDELTPDMCDATGGVIEHVVALRGFAPPKRRPANCYSDRRAGASSSNSVSHALHL